MTFTASQTFKKYPFARLLLSLVTGIILQWYIQLSIQFILTVAIIIFGLLLAFSFLPLQKKFLFRWLQGVLILPLFSMIGATFIYIKDIRNQRDWLGHYYRSSSPLIITLEEPLAGKDNSYKALASVNAIEQNNGWNNT